jgi:hypothetical protein
MFRKHKAALGNAAERVGGLGLPSYGFTLPQNAHRVKSRFDKNLSRELDRAIVGIETTTGRAHDAWRAYKAILEMMIERERGQR